MRSHIFKATNRATKLVSGLPYQHRRSLLSDGEFRFFEALHRAVAGRWGISIKTRLADIVLCPENLWTTPHGRRLSQKHVDFVLYSPDDAAVAAAIELDDRTHQRAERMQRDAFLDEALAAAGVLLLRVSVSSTYRPDSIRRYIDRSIRSKRADSQRSRQKHTC